MIKKPNVNSDTGKRLQAPYLVIHNLINIMGPWFEGVINNLQQTTIKAVELSTGK
ncbi:hypothetical protein [Desulforamulus putei]|uniref:hypothetical protein n=1 Tax=Desulforamulus putei TaxID=74701 RepID=UPI0013564393|nr:hypothetical protein [Desulforamulus putei]